MEKINGLKETPRKAENKVKKKKSRKDYRKVKEKRKKVYKKRSFKELVKGTSLKGKLDWEVSK